MAEPDPITVAQLPRRRTPDTPLVQAMAAYDAFGHRAGDAIGETPAPSGGRA